VFLQKLSKLTKKIINIKHSFFTKFTSLKMSLEVNWYSPFWRNGRVQIHRF